MLIPSWLRGANRQRTATRSIRRASRPRFRVERLEVRDVPSLVPAAPEFIVASDTRSLSHSAIATSASGEFTVVWNSRPFGGDADIFGQRFNSAGQPLGSQFPVNTAGGHQFQARRSIAADSAGNFVVTWEGNGPGDDSGIFARRFASNGTPLGPEFLVNTTTFADQYESTVAVAPNGEFVVTWIGLDQPVGNAWDVYARRFDAGGAPITGEFRVNELVTGNQWISTPAMDANGNFVVVWESGQSGVGWNIRGRQYSSDGTPLGSEFAVSTFTVPGGDLPHPTVAMDATGNIVVAWEGSGVNDTKEIVARRFNNAGQTQGAEFVVNSSVAGNQVYPNISMSANGNFAITWSSDSVTPSGILLRNFGADGIPQGSEQIVTTDGRIGEGGTIAMDSTGDVQLAWGRTATVKRNQTVNRILARRYDETGITPSKLSIGHGIFAEGNSGQTDAIFNVTLSAPSTQTITVQYLTANGTALAGNDYLSTAGALSFAPGEVSKTVTVAIMGDLLGEVNESFSVTLSNPVNTTIADGQAFGTIVDDEPRMSIGFVSQNEGNSGTTLFKFSVTLSASITENVTVSYRTLNGTASSNGGQADFVAKTGTLTIHPGDPPQTIDITVNGDTRRENGETFSVELFNLSGNAWFRDNLGEGMIQNDD